MKRKEITEPERLSRFVESFGGSHNQDFKGLVLNMFVGNMGETGSAGNAGLKRLNLQQTLYLIF